MKTSLRCYRSICWRNLSQKTILVDFVGTPRVLNSIYWLAQWTYEEHRQIRTYLNSVNETTILKVTYENKKRFGEKHNHYLHHSARLKILVTFVCQTRIFLERKLYLRPTLTKILNYNIDKTSKNVPKTLLARKLYPTMINSFEKLSLVFKNYHWFTNC